MYPQRGQPEPEEGIQNAVTVTWHAIAEGTGVAVAVPREAIAPYPGNWARAVPGAKTRAATIRMNACEIPRSDPRAELMMPLP